MVQEKNGKSKYIHMDKGKTGERKRDAGYRKTMESGSILIRTEVRKEKGKETHCIGKNGKCKYIK